MDEGIVTTQPHGQSFIIKRPRLTRLLDESDARIILLVAPAGYGKTTLARQWVEGKEGVVWYSGRPAMADVAALASGLVAACAAAEPELDRLRVLAAQRPAPDSLARAVAGALRPFCSTLVIDDCHHAEGCPDPEILLTELIEETSYRFLLTSRVRPAWIEPRKIIYGEVVAIEVADLAFTDEEARQVMPATVSEIGENLLESAHGWPAVIGLAARRGGTELNADLPTADLYSYFAEDLFRHASTSLQHALILLALGGDTSIDVGRDLLGADHERTISAATESGFMSPSPEDARIHPLLRDFLLSKLDDLPRDVAQQMARDVVEALAARQSWDECLAALERFPFDDLVVSVLRRALYELLDSGRIEATRRWVFLAQSTDATDPIILLAEAEIALRDQDDPKAQALAERAGALLAIGDAAAHAYIVAARAAHLRGDRIDVERNASLALALEPSVNLQTTALWTLFANAAEWSAADAALVLRRLRSVPDPSPDHALRVLNAEGWLLMDAERDLRIAVERFELANGLRPNVRDPLLTTSLLNVLSHNLVHLGRYRDALALVDELIDDAEFYGLDFAIGHALITRAGALVGLRKLLAADRTLREISARSPNATDHVEANRHLQRVRLLIASGDLERAAVIAEREPSRRLPDGFRGEFCAYRGLVLSALSNLSASAEALQEARAFPHYVTTPMLCTLADAINQLKRGTDDAAALCVNALTSVLDAGHADAVVTASRACPELARAGASDPSCARALTSVLSDSNDIDLGRAAGLEMRREHRRRERLSPRERDVCELMVRGRSNKEIAQTLFISESTAKVHVRHIYEKLGVHTRAEAAKAWTENESD